MPLRPWTVIGTPVECRVRRLSPKLGGGGGWFSLKELGIVINRRLESFVAVVELHLTLRRRVKIKTAFQLLEAHSGHVERWIIAVVDDYPDGSLSLLRKRNLTIV